MPWNEGLDIDSPAYKLASSMSKVIRSLAGPGSGKSFAIKRRIARLIEDEIPPEKILAITFTRTSAADLRKEIASIEAKDSEKVLARTVHSHAMAILMKAEVQDIIDRQPRIIIDHELSPAFRDIEKPVDFKVSDKKRLLDTFLAAWATLQNEDPGFPRNLHESEFEKEIIIWLQTHQALLVGEVIPIALKYLRNNPACPEIGKYSAILVDEYQDLNKAEQEFIHYIKGDAEIVIVGDDDQSIYSFKYAHPEGIREIDKLYGNYNDVPFETIRRCPQKVTIMASELISRNSNRTLGRLVPFNKNQEGIVEIVQWGDDKKEIDGLVEVIKNELDSGKIAPGDILILSPRRKIGYKLRDKLLLKDIKVKSYFRESVIDNEKARRAYSLLYLFTYPNDKVSIRFLLGVGAADFRKNQYRALSDYSNLNGLSIRDTLNKVLSEGIKIRGVTTVVQEYRKILDDLNSIKQKLMSAPEELFEIFMASPEDESEFYELISIYRNALEQKPKPTDLFDNKINDWFKDIMKEITESIALPDSPEEIDHVRIMSLHAAKGLSAKFVILTSMIEGLMPSLNKNSTPEQQQKAIEEQRRLFYVAITRCKSSETGYPGRLLISSFIWMRRSDAMQMRIPAGKSLNTRVSATRYQDDFGRTAPNPLKGEILLRNLTTAST